MQAFRRHVRLLVLWVLTITTLTLANPLDRFGWLEFAAALLPLLLLVDRRVQREPALAIGVPALTLLWLLAPGEPRILSLLTAWGIYGVGVWLAARTVESLGELESIAGRVMFAHVDDATEEDFRLALDRELGRARRHDRSFAVLSAAAHPRSLESDAGGHFRSGLLRALAENRARLELGEFLRAELHVYADVAPVGGRVLAVVPEVDEDTLGVLIERLSSACDEHFEFDVQIGAGSFPRDALCADELIDVADRNRTAAKLRSLPERAIGRDSMPAADWQSPDVSA
jgi:hypothetical protein